MYATPEERKNAKREAQLKYRIENTAKNKARSALRYAVKVGKITRLPCQSCGRTKVDAHHADYTKPLDVEWLCRSCHGRKHAEMNLAQEYTISPDGRPMRLEVDGIVKKAPEGYTIRRYIPSETGWKTVFINTGLPLPSKPIKAAPLKPFKTLVKRKKRATSL